jgi:hypothetical protein
MVSPVLLTFFALLLTQSRAAASPVRLLCRHPCTWTRPHARL